MHNGKICLSCIIYYLYASAGYLHKNTKIQQTANYMSKTTMALRVSKVLPLVIKILDYILLKTQNLGC